MNGNDRNEDDRSESQDTDGRVSDVDTGDNDGVGDLGDSLYARKRRELLKLARSLTDLGCVTFYTEPRLS